MFLQTIHETPSATGRVIKIVTSLLSALSLSQAFRQQVAHVAMLRIRSAAGGLLRIIQNLCPHNAMYAQCFLCGGGEGNKKRKQTDREQTR